MKATVDDEVARKAKQQFGVISREQALEAGLSRSGIDRRLRTKALLRFLPGVYRMPGTAEPVHQRILGACLAVGPKALASHATAAFLWNLESIAPKQVDVLAPRFTDRRLDGVVVHTARGLATAGKAKRGPIPVTHLARTLVDLAATVDARRLERMFDAAWRQRNDLPKFVATYVNEIGARGRAGVHTLLELARTRQERPTDSHHEADVLRELRLARLPAPALQHRIFDEQGFITRADFAWVEKKVALFGDGWAHHHGRQSFDRDREQRERLAACGWRPVELSPRLVEGGSWVASVARHLKTAA